MKHESEMTYEELIAEMLKSTQARGHSMLPSFISEQKRHCLWECANCNMEAQVLADPAPNQTYMSGRAVAINCPEPASFSEWVNKVDLALYKECGLGHGDMADQPWREWYDDGMEPLEAATLCLDNEGYYSYLEEAF